MGGLFTVANAWSGGAYELALCYRSGTLTSAQAALRALWADPSVGPCYARCDVEPEDQAALDPAQISGLDPCYGVCLLAGAVRVATQSVAVLYDHGPVCVYFGFPMSSLRRAYPVGAYPFDDGSSLAWRAALDEWLRDLGTRVFRAAPFDCALVAHEPDESVAEKLEPRDIPQRRWEGILVPRDASLEWFPPTEGFPYAFD